MNLGTRVHFRDKLGDIKGVERDNTSATVSGRYGDTISIRFDDGEIMYAVPDELENA